MSGGHDQLLSVELDMPPTMLSLTRFDHGRKHPFGDSYTEPPIAGRRGTPQDLSMSLNLQNDVARRLGYGGPRQAVIASALFGRSCRRLEPSAGDRRERVAGHRTAPPSGDRT
jgi:hypothetical protein